MNRENNANPFNYQVTLQEAKKRYCEQDSGAMAAKSGAKLTENGDLEIVFLAESYKVSPEGEVVLAKDNSEAPMAVKILLLHYLTTAQGVPLQRKLISFKELPGGAIYIVPFTNRAIRPLVNAFGENPQELLEIGKKLGAEQADHGDASISLHAFPFVTLTLVLWGGDDEFPPSGNILFDSSAPSYLATEDYAVLGSMVAAQLKKLRNA